VKLTPKAFSLVVWMNKECPDVTCLRVADGKPHQIAAQLNNPPAPSVLDRLLYFSIANHRGDQAILAHRVSDSLNFWNVRCYRDSQHLAP